MRIILLASFFLTVSTTSWWSEDDFEHDDFLLVVGLVTESKARVLYEALTDEWLGEVKVSVRSDSAEVIKELSIFPVNFAQVIEVDGLKENTNYVVRFSKGTREEIVSFKTMISSVSSINQNLSQRMIIMSCDRFVDFKSDDDFVVSMSNRENKNYDIMVHLGDNIYADKYAAANLNATFEEALEGYRSLYRRGWSRKQMSSMMRHGSHWMIPDDHEVLNALSPDMIEQGANLGLIFAGRRAAYEYELQLHRDIPPISEAKNPGCEAFHRALVFGNTGFLFLDTRFLRSFLHQENTAYPLTGKEQFLGIKSILEDWSERKDVKNIVGFSSVPLFRPTITGAIITDLFENDKYPLHPALINNTLEIAELFVQAGETKRSTILFSGDFHSYYESELCRHTPDGKKKNCLDSIITSGITRGSEGLPSPHLCLLFMTDFGPLSPQHIVDKKTGNIWIEKEYSVAFPLNNYVVLETSVEGELSWMRYLREPNDQEKFLLTLWFEYGKITVPILLVSVLVIGIGLIVTLLYCVKKVITFLLFGSKDQNKVMMKKKQ